MKEDELWAKRMMSVMSLYQASDVGPGSMDIEEKLLHTLEFMGNCPKYGPMYLEWADDIIYRRSVRNRDMQE